MNSFKYFMKEMTMSVTQFPDPPIPDFSQAKNIGHLGRYQILYFQNNGDYYGIEIDGKVVGYLKAIPQGQYDVLQDIYVVPEYRGQHIASNLIFFLKSYLQKSFLAGGLQSKAGQELGKSLARTGRFPMYWLNIKTGEKVPYEVDKDSFLAKPYRNFIEPTDWRILIEGLENNSRLEAALPRFTKDPFKSSVVIFDVVEEKDTLAEYHLNG